MSEPPADDTGAGATGAGAGGVGAGGAGEHAVDAASRGARRGPPVPRRPPRWFTWGVRALLLLPVAGAPAALDNLRAFPPGVGRGVLVALVTAALLVMVAVLWWSAGQPRLDTAQCTELASSLPRRDQRLLQRALYRGDPVPPELRAWVEPYLGSFNSSPLVGGLGMAMGTTGILLSATRPEAFSAIDIALLSLVGLAALVLIAASAAGWWMRRNARRLGLLG